MGDEEHSFWEYAVDSFRRTIFKLTYVRTYLRTHVRFAIGATIALLAFILYLPPYLIITKTKRHYRLINLSLFIRKFQCTSSTRNFCCYSFPVQLSVIWTVYPVQLSVIWTAYINYLRLFPLCGRHLIMGINGSVERKNAISTVLLRMRRSGRSEMRRARAQGRGRIGRDQLNGFVVKCGNYIWALVRIPLRGKNS